MRNGITPLHHWGLASAVASLLILSACMTVASKQNIVPVNTAVHQLGRTKIAVLPVKAQTSLAPDSVAPIRNELNKLLAPGLRAKLPAATIADVSEVANQLNEKGALPALEQLFSTYDSTGVLDKRQSAALGRALGSPHLLLARLKAEKLDIGFLSKGTGGSLELMLVVADTGSVLWSGTGEWKKGGIFGAGGATPEFAAQQLVTLAFSSLPAESGAPATPVQAAPSPPPAATPPPAGSAQSVPANPVEPAAASAPKTRSLSSSKKKTPSAASGEPANAKAGSTAKAGADAKSSNEEKGKAADSPSTAKPDANSKQSTKKVRSVTDL